MNAVDHNNVVIFDDRGIPSIMCRFVRPKDTEEVPAVFKIGDKVADAIYISKYPNIVIDGRAYSMPMADPTVNITFDGAVQACRCKGLGWHLMTAVEYEYLLNQSREKGTMPHGNTDWGNRSGLFTHAIRIIREMRLATNGKYPTFIIWENVPGAFSSNNGEDFRAVLEKVTNANIPMWQA